MTKTENYQLNQWDAADQVRRTDFNADNAKLDAALGALATQTATIPKFAAGSYTGDGAETRTISLPFTPKAVYVCMASGATHFSTSSGYNYYYGGLAITGGSISFGGYTLLEIMNGGFKVGCRDGGTWNIRSNSENTKYHYIAFG